jgi:transposase-like protein
MNAPSFKRWFARFPPLSQPQRLRTTAARHPNAGLERIIDIIDQIRAPERCCPRCACKRCYRHGQANGLQRYRCRECGRSFNDLSGTPLARLRMREKWLDYLATLHDAKSVRCAAFEVGVHRNTAFRWRHRFRDPDRHDLPRQLSGIVEADERFMLESQKSAGKP